MNQKVGTQRHRNSPLAAGDGDLVGFPLRSLRPLVAAVCAHIPTSLLHRSKLCRGQNWNQRSQGKNLVVGVHQPSMVLADTAVLARLQTRVISLPGMVESSNTGLLWPMRPRFFGRLEKMPPAMAQVDMALRVEAVRRSVQMKATSCYATKKSTAIRALLNLGHTFLHALRAADRHFGPVVGTGEAWRSVCAMAFGAFWHDCGALCARRSSACRAHFAYNGE